MKISNPAMPNVPQHLVLNSGQDFETHPTLFIIFFFGRPLQDFSVHGRKWIPLGFVLIFDDVWFHASNGTNRNWIYYIMRKINWRICEVLQAAAIFHTGSSRCSRHIFPQLPHFLSPSLLSLPLLTPLPSGLISPSSHYSPLLSNPFHLAPCPAFYTLCQCSVCMWWSTSGPWCGVKAASRSIVTQIVSLSHPLM